ncbi:MAG: GNAT family N-acetyltransferase [Clostridia bacterium]|nr:GNAT family N-acetyltransferase [Clostridia bacterium]
MKRIKPEQFSEAYKLLERAFVPAELKTLERLLEEFLSNKLEIYGHFQNEILCGVMTVWSLGNGFIFIENFAVSEDMRGQGIGTGMLNEISDLLSPERILLEVETPDCENKLRRVKFYERNGFVLSEYGYTQPALRKNCEPVELRIMYKGKTINEKDFKDVNISIFRAVYSLNI